MARRAKYPKVNKLGLTGIVTLLSGISGTLINLSTLNPPATVKRIPWYALLCAGIGLLLLSGILSRDGNAADSRLSEKDASRKARRDRRTLIFRVQDRLAGESRQALHQVDPISLWCRPRPNAVRQPAPFRESVPVPVAEPPTATVDQVITQAIKSGKSLLVLGEPGSGKTMFMIRLGEKLCEAAAKSAKKIPVYLNLASFARKPGRDLASWLAAEIAERYEILEETAKAWIAGERFILLLDGLDEMPAEPMARCAAAIDGYQREHLSVSITVSVRSGEYWSLASKIGLSQAVEIMLPDQAAVEEYLQTLQSPAAEAMRSASSEDTQWRNFVRAPLVLAMIARISRNSPGARLALSGDTRSRRAQVINLYIDTMLARRGNRNWGYNPASVRQWLAWMARRMTDDLSPELIPDRLNPGWIGDPGKARKIAAASVTNTVFWWLQAALGLYFALLLCLLPSRYYGYLVAQWVLTATFLGILRRYAGDKLYHAGPIRPTEKLTFSWPQARRFAPVILAVSVASGIWAGQFQLDLRDLRHPHDFLSRTPLGLPLDIPQALLGLVFILWCALVTSTDSELDPEIPSPGGGLARSLRFANQAASLSAAGLALLTIAAHFAFGQFALGLSSAGFVILSAGVVSWMTIGGAPYVEYRATCRAFCKAGYAPRRFDKALEYAAERLILLQTGAGYRFIHQEVQAEFAALPAVPVSQRHPAADRHRLASQRPGLTANDHRQ